MPYEISLEQSEEMIANLIFSPSANSESLRIGVSNQAIYLPRKRLFAKADPTYFERVPIGDVLQVHIKKQQPVWMLLLALIMVGAGTALTTIMLWPFLHGGKGDVSGYPPAIAICGLVIPFVVRSRYALIVSAARKGFRWKPPLLIDRTSRQRTQNFFDLLVQACKNAGISTVDDRPARLPSADLRPGKHVYPIAGLPDDLHLGTDDHCSSCSKLIRISRWDSWNKFLVECPHCHSIHGGHWRVYHVLLASLFLNVLSFFFTMRAKAALPWAIGFGLLWGLLLYTEQRWNSNDLVQFLLFMVAIMGPLAVNAVLAMRHEAALSRAKLYQS